MANQNFRVKTGLEVGTGVTISAGIVTAVSFRGDGSALTGIAATTNVRTNSLVVSGVSTFNSGTYFKSSTYYDQNPVRAYFGNSNELSIFSTGTTGPRSYNFIDADSGYLDIRNYKTIIRNPQGVTQRDLAVFDADTFNGEFVKLYYGGNEKFATIGAGVTVTGTTFTNQLSVSGVSTLSTLQVGTGGTIITTTSGGLVGIGTTNPTSKLHVVGDALINDLTIGRGSGSGGTTSTAVGINALVSNTNGSSNTAIGNYALYLNTNGSFNTATGRSALFSNINGIYNTAFGINALYSNSSGGNNVANGVSALYSNTTGNYNVASGPQALFSNISGDNNVSIGYRAGYNATGSSNVFIGPSINLTDPTAQPPILGGSNQLVIGAGSTAWVYGNSSYNVGIGTTNPTSKLHVVGDALVTGIGTITTLASTTLRNYGETVNNVGNTGTAATINLTNGNFVTATLTGNCTFTFTTGLSSGAISFTLVLTNDATPGRSIIWPPAVKWPNATVPTRTTTANRSDVYTFFTYDNGTTWWGNLSLYNYS